MWRHCKTVNPQHSREHVQRALVFPYILKSNVQFRLRGIANVLVGKLNAHTPFRAHRAIGRCEWCAALAVNKADVQAHTCTRPHIPLPGCESSLHKPATQGLRPDSNKATIRIELATVPKNFCRSCKTICSNYGKNKSAQRWNYHSFYSFHFHPPDVNPRGERPQNHTLGQLLEIPHCRLPVVPHRRIHCGESGWYIENNIFVPSEESESKLLSLKNDSRLLCPAWIKALHLRFAFTIVNHPI
ncbi:hypothetical protein Nepgr_032798 [Nepenthes gracilis]|uniref:Uncharacterized protein n=1 Tax=Nepenthes gracilis TaxID=150966 RepID=A0AAD3TK13_NEPGR|nr:hypothetical protein Nepgr_032798 [Nepenthes gracilis]